MTDTVRSVRALLALTLTVSAVLLGSTVLNVALPTMQEDLGARPFTNAARTKNATASR